MAKGQNEALYRVVKFEIHPDEAQVALLRKISDNLWLVWNDALQARQKLFDDWFAPIYEEIKEAAQRQDGAEVAQLRKHLADRYKDHKITLFDQINSLTPRRKDDPAFARVPRNWQEETLDTLDGAYKSFLALRRNGDYKARPPRLRSEWEFCEIPGRFGFKIDEARESISILCGNIADGVPLTFPIASWQRYHFTRKNFLRVKKFTLYRDERDMRESGRFWISLAYEIEKPPEKRFVPERAVYVALGASSIGIVSPKGEEVIPLWRSDKHWAQQIDSAEARLIQKVPGRPALTKGSRKWKKVRAARARMFEVMGRQQTQNRREVVAIDLLGVVGPKLFGHGVHFVVTDLVVRVKEGALADSSKPERGGRLGLNWAAQNTGAIGYLAQWLEMKVAEHGGSVRKHRLPPQLVPSGMGDENKIPMARALRDDFLRSLKESG